MERDFDSPDFKLRDSGHVIRVNQIGYLPESRKQAILTADVPGVYLVDSHGDYVWSGVPKHFGKDVSSGDDVWSIDFSKVNVPGTYHFVCGAGDSFEFEIKDGVYDDTFASIMKAFYFQRCGCRLDKRFAGIFERPACHGGLTKVWDKPDSEIKITGGWHDAGDYGRYVTAACTALAHMLYAYKLYDYSFDDIDVSIPEKNEPGGAIIGEMKFELQWLIRMQRTDGAVFHKHTAKEHSLFVMPQDDKEQQYLMPVSSMATADFAAVCALASGIFSRYDRNFAKYLEGAAITAYHWLSVNPNFKEFKNPEGVMTGEYGEGSDRDNRLWAAVELYNMTGSTEYFDDVKYYLKDVTNTVTLGYYDVSGLAALGWLCEHDSDRDEITGRFRKNFQFRADDLQKRCSESGYGISLREKEYYWGSNMLVLTNACQMAIAAHFCRTSKYDQDILHHLDYILGVNSLGYCFITGNGTFSARDPHLRTAFADNIDECIPGFVVGGPNKKPAEWQLKGKFDNVPPQRCYIDDVRFYSLNEVTIYWNSPAVYLLAYLYSKK